MKILVTGAAGFIGSALCRYLLKRGDDVLGLDNFSPYYDVSLKHARLKNLCDLPQFQFQQLDISDRKALGAAFQSFRPDKVVNLAAQAGVRYSLTHPHVYVEANIQGFLNILEACRASSTQHLVYASSSSVYGANRSLPFRVTDPVNHPVSLYAASKRANELMAHSYSHLYRIPATGLRFFTVYGPWGRPDMSIFDFTRKILAGESIDVFNHGKHRRDFTYVDDIVEGVARVLDRPAQPDPSWNAEAPTPSTSDAPHRIYNIGNSSPVWLSEVIETLEKLLGKQAKKNFLPMQPGDVLDTFADVTDLEKDVGYRPNTPIEAGLSRFIAWYKSYYSK